MLKKILCLTANFVVTFVLALCLIFLPVIFGFIHNYQAMWCTLILGIIGYFLITAILPWYARELRKEDKEPNTIPDAIDILHVKVDKIVLDSVSTKSMIDEFLIQVRQGMHEAIEDLEKEKNKASQDEMMRGAI